MLESGGKRLLLDCGAGVLARLRERWAWPEIESIALTHWHLDHWADVVPWVWGQTLGPGQGTPKPELWIPPGGSELLSSIGTQVGQPEMFAGAFEIHEYADGDEFETAGFRVRPERVLHYSMLAFGFRTSANGTVLAYSGDSGPSDALPRLAADADVFLCEATLAAPNPEGGTRGHLAANEAVEAFEASRAKRLLLTHRPSERPLEAGLEQVHDGFELEL
jgi:ribonuclease BN (tRNA processing enzyme)